MKEFSKTSLPQRGWLTYRKRFLTKAIKINGPFVTHTCEGSLSCPNGYLAIDSAGYPYPIAEEEFDRIYELVKG